MQEKILITVKTYPVLSKKYAELVCTAGVNENGEWRRIYPVQFRQLNDENKYKKYQWIEADIKKSSQDYRPETYQITDPESLKVLGDSLSTDNNWQLRKEAFINKVEIHENLEELIKRAHNNELSLALFKPQKWIDFVVEETEREWDPKKLRQIEDQKRQFDFFKDEETIAKELEVVDKLPYKFSYRFEDETRKNSKLMIEDWEIGALYRNCLKQCEGDEGESIKKVRQKYVKDFIEDKGKDVLLVLGTTLQYHRIAPNPFLIISVIPLPLEKNPSLF